MALPNLLRKLFKNDGYGPELQDAVVSKEISVQDYDFSHDYGVNALVKAGGTLFRSVAVSGPGTAAGARNPASDDGTYWTAVPLDDADVVHKTGDETISGEKTFSSGHIGLTASYPSNDTIRTSVLSRILNYTIGTIPSTTIFCGQYFYDKDFNDLGFTEFGYYPSGDALYRMTVTQNKASNPVQTSVFCVVESNGTKYFRPDANGSIGLGIANHRWGQIYSTSSTISTSDGRLKTAPESIPDEVLDAWGDIGFVQFQMLDSVAEKGEKNARLHSGIIAQQIESVFRSRGLDASRYGLFCWDKWEAEPEERNAKGIVVSEGIAAGDMYSLRYEEALCMEAAYQRRRAGRAEARIASLEARLAALEAKLNG